MADQYAAPPAPRAFAGWGARFGALILDSIPTAVVFTVLTVAFGDNETSSSGFSFNLSGLPFLVYLVFALGWFVYNWLVRQGSTGQTWGKKIVGVSVLDGATQQPIGGGMTFVRQVAHLLDGIPCLIG